MKQPRRACAEDISKIKNRQSKINNHQSQSKKLNMSVIARERPDNDDIVGFGCRLQAVSIWNRINASVLTSKINNR
jgi:hypothetical protein